MLFRNALAPAIATFVEKSPLALFDGRSIMKSGMRLCRKLFIGYCPAESINNFLLNSSCVSLTIKDIFVSPVSIFNCFYLYYTPIFTVFSDVTAPFTSISYQGKASIILLYIHFNYSAVNSHKQITEAGIIIALIALCLFQQ